MLLLLRALKRKRSGGPKHLGIDRRTTSSSTEKALFCFLATFIS
jgi:hypothetical protein